LASEAEDALPFDTPILGASVPGGYREKELLGRALNPAEAREVMNMARRIAALLLLQP